VGVFRNKPCVNISPRGLPKDHAHPQRGETKLPVQGCAPGFPLASGELPIADQPSLCGVFCWVLFVNILHILQQDPPFLLN